MNVNERYRLVQIGHMGQLYDLSDARVVMRGMRIWGSFGYPSQADVRKSLVKLCEQCCVAVVSTEETPSPAIAASKDVFLAMKKCCK